MTPENPTLFSYQLLTKGDLVEFKNILISELKELINHNPKPKQWLKSGEVRELLKISSGTLQNLRINGTLNYTKVGNIIYYKHEDILNILENN